MTFCIDGLLYQHSLCSSTDEIAVFWSMFSKARQLGEIREGQDYKISQISSLKVSIKSDPQKPMSLMNQPTFYLSGKRFVWPKPISKPRERER